MNYSVETEERMKYNFGAGLRRTLNEKGITMSSLAERTGISYNTLRLTHLQLWEYRMRCEERLWLHT
ncbi:MAG: helix-turn-helix domain-containing protein [Lentihominibacter sp.]